MHNTTCNKITITNMIMMMMLMMLFRISNKIVKEIC